MLHLRDRSKSTQVPRMRANIVSCVCGENMNSKYMLRRVKKLLSLKIVSVETLKELFSAVVNLLLSIYAYSELCG